MYKLNWTRRWLATFQKETKQETHEIKLAVFEPLGLCIILINRVVKTKAENKKTLILFASIYSSK